jgi:hypothetical protein
MVSKMLQLKKLQNHCCGACFSLKIAPQLPCRALGQLYDVADHYTILAFCAAVSPNEVMSALRRVSPLYILQTHSRCRQKWHVEFQFFRSFEHGRTKFLLIRRLGEARQDAF